MTTSCTYCKVVTAGDEEEFFGGADAVVAAAGPHAHAIRFPGYHCWETEAVCEEACRALQDVGLLVALRHELWHSSLHS